jgi:alcohol dehydrogenase class IV
MAGFFTSPRIAWGPGAIEQLSGLGARRALVVADRGVAGSVGVRRIVEELAKSDAQVELVGDVEHPDRLEEVSRLRDRIVGAGSDWVVVVGGGRMLDGAKAARLAAETPDAPVGSLDPMGELPDPLRHRLVAIPTTSGSGAEASWVADLVGPDGIPLEIAHRAMVPDWVLVDAELARGLPPELVSDGAFETAALAVEAYVSAWANPFSDALALDALATVVRRLPHALKWSDDPEARSALHYAATSAGLASSNAQRGIAHALARALVAPTGLPYGRLAGIALPFAVEFDHPSARDRLEALGSAVASTEDAGRSAGPLAQRLRRLGELARFPASLSAAGVAADRVEAAMDSIVERTLRSPAVLANPRVPTPGDVRDLVHAIVGLPEIARR